MQFGGPGRVLVGEIQIAEGKQGTRQTLQIMSRIVRRYRSDPIVLAQARGLVGFLGQKDYFGEIRALHRFVRDEIRYVRDPIDVETVATPDQTLRIGQGDCDDKAVLLASMLEALGNKTRFVAVGFAPNDYMHVLVQARAGPGWINLETTEPVQAGWGPRDTRTVMVVNN